MLSPAESAALLFAIRNPGPQRLVKSSTKPGLFPSKPSSARLFGMEPALLEKVGADGVTPIVELTALGLQEAQSILLVAYKNTVVEGREAFLDGLGSLREALEDRIQADEASTAAAEREADLAKYRKERDRHRVKREVAEETASHHARLEAEFESLLKNMAERAQTFPEVKEADRDFRKAVVREMAKASFDFAKRGDKSTTYILDSMLRKIPDVERLGEVGESVEFAPNLHESEEFLDPGTRATIRFSGWQIRNRNNDTVTVIRKASVE